jgi:phenylacetate-coenzyme A ligase PaaK-like adenylate-forming protein
MSSMVQRVDWDRAMLEAHSTTALRSLLAMVARKSAWHSERLAGINTRSLELSDIRRLPIMTKHDLLDNFDRIVTDPALSLTQCREWLERQSDQLLHTRYHVSQSGGTSGVPSIAVFTPEEKEINTTAALRVIQRLSMRQGWRMEDAVSATITSVNPAFRAQQVGRDLGRSAILDVRSPVGEIVRKLNNHRPDILVTYPSLLKVLAYETRHDRLHIAPNVIVCGAEPLLPDERAEAESTWECPLINGWGSSELGVLGASSGFEPGILLFDDMAVIECLDEAGMPALEGERCTQVLVTPLYRRTLPLIRYEVADRLTLLPTRARCGSGFRLAGDVEGRQTDDFQYNAGIRVESSALSVVLARHSWVLQYQLRQTPDGLDASLVRGDEGTPLALQKEIAQLLADGGLRTPRVQLDFVDELPRTRAAAKLVRFVPLEPSPDHSAAGPPADGLLESESRKG